jgi:hypothetical protein
VKAARRDETLMGTPSAEHARAIRRGMKHRHRGWRGKEGRVSSSRHGYRKRNDWEG